MEQLRMVPGEQIWENLTKKAEAILLEACAKDYEEVKKRHIADYQALYTEYPCSLEERKRMRSDR